MKQEQKKCKMNCKECIISRCGRCNNYTTKKPKPIEQKYKVGDVVSVYAENVMTVLEKKIVSVKLESNFLEGQFYLYGFKVSDFECMTYMNYIREEVDKNKNKILYVTEDKIMSRKEVIKLAKKDYKESIKILSKRLEESMSDVKHYRRSLKMYEKDLVKIKLIKK